MRFTLIISTWAQNVRTFPSRTISVLKYREYVKLVVGEYQEKYCKPSYMIRKQKIYYGKYIYIIYSAHICHHWIIIFPFTFLFVG